MESHSNQPAGKVEPNKVLVTPGNREYTSIQAAIDSITDAGAQKRYMVYIGPGTYNESVVMKEWVYLQGAGQDEYGKNHTIITASGGTADTSATLKAASNTALATVTVESRVGTPGNNMCACIDTTGVTKFRAYGVHATAYDSTEEACNLFAVVNNRGTTGPTCSADFSRCVFVVQAQHPKTYAIALWSVFGGTYEVRDSKLVGTGTYNGVGAAGNPGASTLTFTRCAITGTHFSLETTDDSTVKAVDCSLAGPVDKGVIVS